MTEIKDIRYILSGNGNLAMVIGEDLHTISAGHPNHFEILCALQDGRYNDAEALVDVAGSIGKRTNGLVTYADSQFFYNGPAAKGTPRSLHAAICNRMFDLIEGGYPSEYLLKFVENMFQNPRPVAVEELYLFLEHNKLPITEDGCFLAYKRVDANFKDCYTGKIDNSIGATPSVEYDTVDPDRDRTCSNGLHFCDFGYLAHFGGENTILVKINPKDVVAIPNDYSNQKGRCCGYTVIKVHEQGDAYDIFTGKDVVPLYTATGEKSKTSAYYDVRDTRGRFVKQADREKKDGKYSVRDALGRFVKRIVGTKVPDTEPDLPYHSNRDTSGRFAKKD